MRIIFVIFSLIAVGCKTGDSTDAKLTENTRTPYVPVLKDLVPLRGNWLLKTYSHASDSVRSSCPRKIKILETIKEPLSGDDDPLKNTPVIAIRLLEADGTADLRAFHRSDFVNIGGRNSCVSESFSPSRKTAVCHQSWIEEKENSKTIILTHRVTIADKLGLVFHFIPAGSTKADQSLTWTNGQLSYQYSIDGKIEDTCEYERLDQ